MISRYVDGLMKSASRAKEFMTAKEADKPRIFVEFIDGLKVAAGSAHQLAMAQSNPNFLGIRDTIEQVIKVGQNLPTFTGNQAGLWFSIKISLEGLADKGQKMATAKAMTRQAVLQELDIRKNIISKELNDG